MCPPRGYAVAKPMAATRPTYKHAHTHTNKQCGASGPSSTKGNKSSIILYERLRYLILNIHFGGFFRYPAPSHSGASDRYPLQTHSHTHSRAHTLAHISTDLHTDARNSRAHSHHHRKIARTLRTRRSVSSCDDCVMMIVLARRNSASAARRAACERVSVFGCLCMCFGRLWRMECLITLARLFGLLQIKVD